MSAAEIQFACFIVGAEYYGTDIMSVREIIRYRKVTSVPRAPDFIEGVITIRGEALPVVDMRKRLGLEEKEPTRDTRIMIVKVADKDVGIIVDAVSKVIKVGEDEVLQAPAVAKGIESEYLTGVVNDGDEIVLILDMDKVLTTTERLSFEGLASSPDLGGDHGKDHGGDAGAAAGKTSGS